MTHLSENVFPTSVDFLKTEYQECMSLIKYYDEKHLEMAKYVSVLTPGVIVAIFVLGGFERIDDSTFWGLSAFLSFAGFVSTSTMFAAMLANRKYFVRPAQQVNWIRKELIGRLDHKMYDDPDEPKAFNRASAHIWMNWFVCVQIGAFAGLSVFSILAFLSVGTTFMFWCGFVVGAAAAALAARLSWRYLTKEESTS